MFERSCRWEGGSRSWKGEQLVGLVGAQLGFVEDSQCIVYVMNSRWTRLMDGWLNGDTRWWYYFENFFFREEKNLGPVLVPSMYAVYRRPTQFSTINAGGPEGEFSWEGHVILIEWYLTFVAEKWWEIVECIIQLRNTRTVSATTTLISNSNAALTKYVTQSTRNFIARNHDKIRIHSSFGIRQILLAIFSYWGWILSFGFLLEKAWCNVNQKSIWNFRVIPKW